MNPVVSQPESRPCAQPEHGTPREDLGHKAVTLRISFRKLGPAVYFSQLELTRLFERAMRRAGLPISFSQGFHPMPRMSFGRALPVGVGSTREEMIAVLRRPIPAGEAVQSLAGQMPRGLEILDVAEVANNSRAAQPGFEEYLLQYAAKAIVSAPPVDLWQTFFAAKNVDFVKKTKRGTKVINLRGLFASVRLLSARRMRLILDFRQEYLNPWAAVQAVTPGVRFDQVGLTKLRGFEEASP